MYFIYILYGIKKLFRWWDRLWYISLRSICYKEYIFYEMGYKLVFSKVNVVVIGLLNGRFIIYIFVSIWCFLLVYWKVKF